MNNIPTLNNAVVLATYAKDDIDIWRRCIGKTVVHRAFGQGTIVSVKEGSPEVYLYILFPGQPKSEQEKRFKSQSFKDGFFDDIEFPDGLVRMDIEQQALSVILSEEYHRKKEEEERQERIRRTDEHIQRMQREWELKEEARRQKLAEQRRIFEQGRLTNKRYKNTLLMDISGEYCFCSGAYHLAYYFPKSRGDMDGFTSLIWGFKDNNPSYVKLWSSLAAEELSKAISIDVVVRALGSDELVSYGNAPLDELCKFIAFKCKASYEAYAIKKKRKIEPLKGKGKSQREEELKDVYYFECSRIKDGSAILIVDDITTTGSSARAICNAIKKMLPNSKVYFFSIGKTHDNHSDGIASNNHLVPYFSNTNGKVCI